MPAPADPLYAQVPVRPGTDIILFFTPEAGITPHFAAQCVLAKTLQERGHEVRMVRCAGLLSRCPVMDMKRAPYDLPTAAIHQQHCVGCTETFDSAIHKYGLPTLNLADFISKETIRSVQAALETAPGSLLEFEFDGLKFGKVTGADVALILKYYDLANAGLEQRLAWLTYLRSALLVYLALEQACAALPIKRICAFNVYSLLGAAALAARKLQIPFISVTQAAHKDIDRQSYVILPRLFTPQIRKDMIHEWYRWRDLPLRSVMVEEVADDLVQRQGGRGAQHYSPPKSASQEDLLGALSLSRDRKLLLAFPSTFDELVSLDALMQGFDQGHAIEHLPFDSQFHWLSALIDYVEASDDLQLVVRIHPRESRNKRESAVSQSLPILRAKYDRPYRHCRVLWPEDPISSYDLAEIADLGCTSWSTLGLELARLGLPVITAYRHFYYPDDDFHQWGGEDVKAYFSTLREMLERPISLETIRRAYRCYSYSHLAHSLKLDDVVPSPDFTGLPDFMLTRHAASIEDVFLRGTHPTYFSRKKMVGAQGGASELEEAQALRLQLRRIMHFCATGVDRRGEVAISLIRPEDNSEVSLKPHSALLTIAGRSVRYVYQGNTYTRYSPLIARLADLACDLEPQQALLSKEHFSRNATAGSEETEPELQF